METLEETKPDLKDWQKGFLEAKPNQETVEATTTPAAETTTTEVTTETTEAPPAKLFSDVVKAPVSEDEQKRKQLEDEILGKYKPQLEKLESIEKNEALKFIVEKWGQIDHSKAFANTTKTYDHLSHLDLLLEVAKSNGIELTPEKVEAEKEKLDAKLDAMSPIEQDLYKKELIGKLPKGEDNSTYLEKIKAQFEAEEQAKNAQVLEEQKYWKGKEEYAMSIKDKLVDVVIVPELGTKISGEMVESVYKKLAQDFGSPRFNDEKGEYHPEWHIEALAYEEVGRNIAAHIEAAKTLGKSEAVSERTNASQNTETVASAAATQLTPEQVQQRRDIYFAYGKNPERLKEELTKAKLI